MNRQKQAVERLLIQRGLHNYQSTAILVTLVFVTLIAIAAAVAVFLEMSGNLPRQDNVSGSLMFLGAFLVPIFLHSNFRSIRSRNSFNVSALAYLGIVFCAGLIVYFIIADENPYMYGSFWSELTDLFIVSSFAFFAVFLWPLFTYKRYEQRTLKKLDILALFLAGSALIVRVFKEANLEPQYFDRAVLVLVTVAFFIKLAKTIYELSILEN